MSVAKQVLPRERRPVLDHGFVRLVDHMGNDLSIVRAARVSHNADWRAGTDEGSDERLIRYLMKHRHSTPFEAVQFQFEIKCPIFIARQWHRHRTWTYNEISARYSELDEGYYCPSGDVIGLQSKENKQVRELGLINDDAAADIAMACRRAWDSYRDLLGSGVPRELARSVLPMATYTRFFGSVNLHNLLHFLELRLHQHAQWEIQQYALALFELARTVAPAALRAFELRLSGELWSHSPTARNGHEKNRRNPPAV